MPQDLSNFKLKLIIEGKKQDQEISKLIKVKKEKDLEELKQRKEEEGGQDENWKEMKWELKTREIGMKAKFLMMDFGDDLFF